MYQVLYWDGTAKPVSRDQILRRERGQGNIHFPCSAEYEQDWQPYPVDIYSCCMCDYTYHTLWEFGCRGPAAVIVWIELKRRWISRLLVAFLRRFVFVRLP